jgi:xanthine dehydrogenase accessory factor
MKLNMQVSSCDAELQGSERPCTASGTEDVLDHAIAWLEAGRRVATATVIRTHGSAPRPVGSQLAVNDRTAFVGSVSAGCVEAATVRAALEAMSDGQPRRLHFDVSQEDAFRVGLTCGGELQVFVQSVTRERALLEELRAARERHEDIVVATALDDAKHRLFAPPHGAGALAKAARAACLRDRSEIVPGDGREWFLHVRKPQRRLVVVGAVHIAQALVLMATLNGFAVTLIDPREAFATAERFPGTRIEHRAPHEIMERLAIDCRTAVVTLSHQPRFDDPALAHALRANAFYVGALGSHRSHAARLVRLSALGLSEGELSRIHGPVGLPIGAVTAAEIATSIIADIVHALRRPSS